MSDTSDTCHWGCAGTSWTLSALIKQVYDLIETIKITEIEKANIPAVTIGTDFDSQKFYNDFSTRNKKLLKKLSKTDVVIMNGEGTMHGTAPLPLKCLYILYIAKTKLNKKIMIVNHSCYPCNHPENNQDPKIIELYKRVYAQLDYIAVREKISHEHLKTIGISSHLSFDCLPLYIHSTFPDLIKTQKTDNKTVIIAGSSGIDDKGYDQIFQFITYLYESGFEPTLISGARIWHAHSEDRFINTIQKKFPHIQHRHCNSIKDWLSALSNAYALISGRFHHSLACLTMGTPIITFEGNTPKLHAICKELDIDKPITYQSKDINTTLTNRFENINQKQIKTLPMNIINRAFKNIPFTETNRDDLSQKLKQKTKRKKRPYSFIVSFIQLQDKISIARILSFIKRKMEK